MREVKFRETFIVIDGASQGATFTDSVQYLSDYLSAFMVARIYFFYKDRFNNSRYRDPFSKQICKEHNFYTSNWFILKVKNEKKPVKTVFLTSLTLIYIVWWWLLLFELETLIVSENTQTIRPEFASLYLTMITLTTVGYGDISPQTKVGRLVIMFAAVCGII